MKYGYFLLSLFLFCNGLSAQRQATTWHFAAGESIRFVAGSAQVIPPSNIVAFEGSVTLSDSTGLLLFYTNGGNKVSDNTPPTVPGAIWNREDDVFFDFAGTRGGSYDAYQPALAFAKPDTSDRYCLFTVDESNFDTGGPVAGQPQGRGLRYFEIDMRANGGLGAVVIADQPVHVPAEEGLSGTLHDNGRDYWVVTYQAAADNLSNRFVVVPVTADGPGTPAFYPQPNPINGVIKMAPNGRWLYCAQRIYPFDPATGEIGTPISGIFPNLSNIAATFTADSRYLYTVAEGAEGRRLSRFDLQAPDVAASEQIVAMFAGETIGQMQLAPNGRIYFHEKDFPTESYGLSEIICPAGVEPTVDHRAIPLTGEAAPFSFGLPNYTDHIFRVTQRADTIELPLETVEICPGSSVTLSPRYPGRDHRWSGGASAEGPTLTVSEAGDYLLTQLDTCGRTVLDPRRIVIAPDFTGQIEPVADREFYCPGESVDFTVAANVRIDSLRWFDGSTSDTLSIALTEAIIGQGIQATVFTACSTEALDLALPQLDTTGLRLTTRAMTGDLACGQEVELAVTGLPYDSLRWPDGSTGEVLFVELVEDSLYRVEVFIGCATLELSTTLPCQPECELEIPNIFSPNRDEQNDEFGAYTNCAVTDFTLQVYSRWGQLVFSTTDPDRRWDGTKDGRPLPMDVYLYRMVYRFPEREEPEVRDGEVTLVR